MNRGFGKRSEINISGAFRHGITDFTPTSAILVYECSVLFQQSTRKFLACAEESDPKFGGYERLLGELKQRGLLHGRA